MATFGERVKELRKEKGQTMREVVDGVNPCLVLYLTKTRKNREFVKSHLTKQDTK